MVEPGLVAATSGMGASSAPHSTAPDRLTEGDACAVAEFLRVKLTTWSPTARSEREEKTSVPDDWVHAGEAVKEPDDDMATLPSAVWLPVRPEMLTTLPARSTALARRVAVMTVSAPTAGYDCPTACAVSAGTTTRKGRDPLATSCTALSVVDSAVAAMGASVDPASIVARRVGDSAESAVALFCTVKLKT